MSDNNKNLNQSNEILDLINTTNNDKDYKLQILRKLKFIGDRGQIVSAMKDNENNFTSRTLLGSGDRIFIAYALEQQEPIIFSNQFITRLYVPNILPNSQQLKIIEQNLLRKNTSTDYNNKPKEYILNDIFSLINKNENVPIDIYKVKDTEQIRVRGIKSIKTLDDITQ